MATNFGTGSNRTIFSDGEGLTSGDLTDISKNAIRRAWEIPGVADLVAFDLLDATYNGAMVSATALKGRNTGVFTVGGGLCPGYASNNTGIDRGVIGIWTESTAVSLPGASGDGKMLWGLVDTATAGLAVAHDNPATELYRWDLISVSASEIDIATVTRDYKDATTGAETSEDVVPAKNVQFAYTVTKGTEGAVGAVTVPALPAGERYLYAAKLFHGSSIASVVELRDYTIPLGKLQTVAQAPSHALDAPAGIDFDDIWSFGSDGSLYALSDTVVGTAAFSPPPQACRPDARILGFTLAYEINNSTGDGDVATFKLMRRTMDGATVDVEVTDLTSRLTYDGSKQRVFIDLRGIPADPGGAIVQPLWGNGKTAKTTFVHTYDAYTAPYLKLTSPSRAGSECLIYGITWFFVG